MATITVRKRTTRGVSAHTRTQRPFRWNIAAKLKLLQDTAIVSGEIDRQEKINEAKKKKQPPKNTFHCFVAGY